MPRGRHPVAVLVGHPVVMARGRGRRRWARWTALGLGGAAVLAVGVGLALWQLWFPHYRPDLQAGERYGIDVASHQGVIDWEQVAGDDVEWAYIKATEGGDFTDARFARNWDHAGAVGLDHGAYHFFTLCRPGAEQAAHFLDVVPEAGTLPHAVDLELAGNCAARPPADEVRHELDAFLDTVESATGRPVVLYIGDDWEGRYPTRGHGDRPLWHRRVLLRPDGDDWWIWQYSGDSRVEGIHGDVDLNVMQAR